MGKNGSQIFSSVLVGVSFSCFFLKINQLLFEIAGSLSSDLPAERSPRHLVLFTRAAASQSVSSLTAEAAAVRTAALRRKKSRERRRTRWSNHFPSHLLSVAETG